jgi:putative ABC transport system permease protein
VRHLWERLAESIHRAAGTFRGRRDADLEEELRLHLELAAEDERRRAGSPGAGRRAAIRSGGVSQTLDALRDQRGLPWLDALLRDARYGSRILARNPGFTIVAVVSLAIGIGANCAVFSFADALLLRPLTVPRASEVVTVGSPAAFGPALVASYRDYLDIRDRSRSFDALVAYTSSTVAFATGARAVPVPRIGMLVSADFFPSIGVAPLVGRAFRQEENEVPGRDAVVVLGHDLWSREYGEDQSIVGRTVRMNGLEFTVVGVAPAEFTGLDRFTRFEFFAPLMMAGQLTPDSSLRALDQRDDRALTIKGRLRAGVTLRQAHAELATIARDLERAYPDTNRSQTLVVRTELQDRFAESGPNVALTAMLAFLAAAVLCVACANVAGLLASRAPVRAREIALRLAIGAGRGRVVRQLITESLLVAGLGGALGIVVGYGGVLLFRRFRIPTSLPIAVSFRLDQRALAVCVIVALVSAVLFGVMPAIRAARADLTAVMKAGDAAGPGGRRQWGRGVLVAGQVAIAVVLLAVATFIYRDFRQQMQRGPGFRRDHLVMMWIDPGMLHYTDAQSARFFENAAERAAAVPGVKAVTLSSFVPMDGGVGPVRIVPEGFRFPEGREHATLLSGAIDHRFFDVLGLSIVRGRGVQETDGAGAPRVAVVNEQTAQHFWPGQDPIGKRFRVGSRQGPWVEIVGVAKTSQYSFLIEPPRDYVYFPYRQRPMQFMALVAETTGEPARLAVPLRDAVRTLDPNLPIHNVRTVEEMYRMRVVSILNVIVTLIAAMGIMGLALAFIGLYGLVAYGVSRRTKEIGIRIAIGAGNADILRMVLTQGTRLAVAGLGVGLLASVGADRALAAAFPSNANGRPGSLGGFALVAAIVLAVTVLAAYVPARRASQVNPTDALRNE